MKKILYIGTYLTKKNNYNSSISTLSSLLINEGYSVRISSDKQSKIIRLLDMIKATIKHRNYDYILIDTFSTSNFYYALIVSQIARIFKIRYIPILRGGNLPNRLDDTSFLSYLIFNHSYINVAPSDYLKYEFEKRNYNTVLIPNIININKYPFKNRVKLKPNLLYVRAFDKIYNPIMAVKVLERLKQKYKNAKLCMIGPFKDDSIDKVKQYIKDKNLSDFIEITGVLPKEQWHKKSKEYDIFINTTNYDNTPVSVMEAMALGLPVVSTNAGGLPYLIDNNIDGILVSKNNIKQMSNAIINLIETPELSSKIIKSARKKVEHFDWEYVKNKWEKLFND
jgi:glycosyltransferase involved in cell wall biosynthesis